jgi:hypothetical protein
VVGNPFHDPDFPRKTVDLIDRFVGAVRDRTTKPIVALTRGLVFGSLVAVVSIALVTLLLIALMRGTQELLELAVSERRAVWVSYFVVGSAFILIGALLMRARHSSQKDTP